MHGLDAVAAHFLAAVINVVWQSVAVALVASIVLAVARRANASTRYAVLWVAMAGIVVLFATQLAVGPVSDQLDGRPPTPRLTATTSPTTQTAPASATATGDRPAARVSTPRDTLPEEAAPVVSPPTRADRPPGFVLHTSPLLPLIVFGLWLLIAAFRLARIVAGLGHMGWLKAASDPLPPEIEQRLAGWLVASGTPRCVRFRSSRRVSTPVVAGLRTPTILFPADLVRKISRDELDQLSLHELAHLRRWDDWANLAQKLIEAVLFFNPVVIWLGRRLTLEREIACDDSAIAATGKPHAYAACLTRLVERAGAPSRLSLAPDALGRPSHFFRRVEMLLDRKRNRTTRISTLVLGLTLIVFGALALSLGCTGQTFEVSVDEEDGGRGRFSIHTETDGKGKIHAKWSNGWRTLQVKARGTIVFSEDDTEITSVSEGGYVVISERDGLHFKRLEINPQDNGTLRYRYYVAGSKREYDNEGRAWLAETLPTLIDETGLGAEVRARRLLEEGGPDAVLEKIAGIESDYTKTIYYRVMIEQGNLDLAGIEKTQRSVSDHLESDYYKTVVIDRIAEHPLGNDARGEAFFDVIATLDSDYHKAVVLTPIAEENELASVPLDDYFEAVATLDSEYHRTVILGHILEHQPLDDELFDRTLALIDNLGSEYHRVVLLDRIAGHVPTALESRDAYYLAIDAIGSDYHRQQLLYRILEKHDLDAGAFSFVLESAAGLGSDYNKAQMLEAMVDVVPADGPTMDRFLDAVATVGSEHYLAQLIESVLDRDDLSEAVLRRMLELVKREIDSTHNRGRLVEEITDRILV